MALITKIAPVGIDFVVDVFQRALFAKLSLVWSDYESYPRSYKNPSGNNVIPEHYLGENEYKEVLWDDKFKVSSFFLSGDERTVDDFRFTQTLSIIFQADIDKLYPAVTHRADEEMHADIIAAFEQIEQQENITSLVNGINNVYGSLSLNGRLKDLVEQDDMSNLHFVKVDFTVLYDICDNQTEIY